MWNRRTRPPPVQADREGKNTSDVKREPGARMLRWKIEKRVLERIKHLMMMEDDGMTKAVMLGWKKEQEKWEKFIRRSKKMVLH